ncbi:thiol peroxidase [Pseudoalteromonas sp. MMG010]|uniref:thiol peroxidase n=1 Tax=Pseudoalteromonas sp. MMG010 TaxID=2822685 RepID=UPI001B39E8C0|nr:thiol peroxidase [Pseudoalteromonas sp. MMG010]MBQ4833243.1 thiol peroxidase [Pseudoalteromonas sp. MMG010]
MLRIFILGLNVLCSSLFAYEPTINSLDAGSVSVQNKPVTLLGQGVKVGTQAPNFKLVDRLFSPITLSHYKGRALLLSTVPSLDTGVCKLQTKSFNNTVAEKFPNITILSISTDLPFAQRHFCDTQSLENVTILSDSVWRDVGDKFGLIIQGMGLLTRAVFILDKEHKIIYKQIVDDLSHEPDYPKIFNVLENLQ